MGKKRRSDFTGESHRYPIGWSPDNPGSSGEYERFLASGIDTRFRRKYALPSIGDRFGELTVIGLSPASRDHHIEVQCSCGAPPHGVNWSNLRKGASTRCNVCARQKASKHRKQYWGYENILPDIEHRRRLLNRISACIGRCRPGNTSSHAKNYAGRGIKVHPEWLGGTEGKRKFLSYLITLDGWDVPELELDRIDVDGNYEPGNLRFISRRENMANKRSVPEMQKRIAELERRLRHCTCGAAQPVHD